MNQSEKMPDSFFFACAVVTVLESSECEVSNSLPRSWKWVCAQFFLYYSWIWYSCLSDLGHSQRDTAGWGIIISCAFCKKTTTFSEYPLDKIQLNVKENLCNCLLTDALHRLLSYFTVSKCSRPWEAVLLCHRPRRCRSGSLLVCSLISSASFGVSVSSWYSFPHARRTIKNLNSAS